ncbi:MAG: acetyl ornithine aminotransferase family protein [Methanomassiliicoccales archaeon]|jgi:4-aminobutyrate aminotransferase
MTKVPSIRVEPPGEKAKKIVREDEEYLATSTKGNPLVVDHAKGASVWDVDGNSYIDFVSGVAVMNVGHCNQRVTGAVCEQIKKFSHFAGADFYYKVQAELARRLAEASLGSGKKKVFLSNSGAEAVEAAMKLARWSTGRKRYVSFVGGFHGRTFGALSLTGSKTVQQERYFPEVPGVIRIPYGNCYRCPYKLEYPKCGIWCAKVLEEVYFESFLPPDEIAGLFMEPIQGEGGYIVPPSEFVQQMSLLCKKYGILFVDDEVQAGMGRTGRMWGIEHHDVVPDVMCVAKALGSGVPIAATIFRKELDWTKKGAHSNTFGGNALACAAALATLDEIEERGLVEQASRKGEHLRKRLEELAERFNLIGDVRGFGLMQATELVKDRRTKEYAVKERDRIEALAFKRGLIVIGCGRSTLRYIPPLVVTTGEIDSAMDILEGCFKDVECGKA